MTTDERRRALAKRHGLTRQEQHRITARMLDQLDQCKDDDARRLILGVSHRTTRKPSVSR